MTSKTIFARSAAAGLAISAFAIMPAMAADVVFEEPPAPTAPVVVAPVESWAGPYVGLSLGYGFQGDVSGAGEEIETDGWMGGAFGGFNMQNGSFVYGAEADVNYSGVDGEAGGLETETGFDGSIRGRAGMAVNENILVYGTAGVAAQTIEVNDTVAGTEDDGTMLGYTVGAGTDIKLTDQVFARGEYRYTDYGSEDIGGAEFDASNHRVSVGLGIQF